MRKVILPMFGGTPVRGEICMYLNCAAGIYENCEIHCYPIDKDTKSPNYVDGRNFYNQYKDFRTSVKGGVMASAEVVRNEALFESMLEKAGISAENENILYMLSREEELSNQDKRVISICFTKEEQEKELKGGYYGKANIGSITSDILIYQGIYQMINICKDIEDGLKAGDNLDVVIICSSFGGTGASLGINFGEYLRETFVEREKLHIHCIHIQPYFSFPNPDEDDKWQMNYKQFYAKSATVVTILGQKKGFIKTGNEKNAVFDSFYYLGQEVLDSISDTNAAVDKQDNRIHLVDMLVSLAINDILMPEREEDTYLYGYQYANEGTEFLSWEHMPSGIGFKTKHVCFMRFCEFMLDCMEPIFKAGFPNYDQETLIVWLYGGKGTFWNKKAKIIESVDSQLRNEILKCCEFCRGYIKYWLELEKTTKFGNTQDSVTRFFNIEELNRLCNSKMEDYETIRSSVTPDELTQVEVYKNYPEGKKSLDIYDDLCNDHRLKEFARPGRTGQETAGILMKTIYEKCAVAGYRNAQD